MLMMPYPAIVFREAILRAQPLRFQTGNYDRVFCPHVLGLKHGDWHVLGRQLAGTTDIKHPRFPAWCCLGLHDICGNIEPVKTAWDSGPNNGAPRELLMDWIDIQIDPDLVVSNINIFMGRNQIG